MERRSPTRARVTDPGSTNPRELGARLGETVRSAAPDIVSALIEQAKAGNCTPAKFLFDFAGLVSASAPDPAAEECLAALLLRELERQQAGGDQAPGTVQ